MPKKFSLKVGTGRWININAERARISMIQQSAPQLKGLSQGQNLRIYQMTGSALNVVRRKLNLRKLFKNPLV